MKIVNRLSIKYNLITSIVIFLLFIFILLLRIPILFEHHNFDELGWIADAKAMLTIGTFSIEYPTTPILTAIYAVIYSITNMNVIYFRVLVTLVILFDSILVYFITNKFIETKSRAGIISSLVFLALMGLPSFQGQYLTRELINNTFLLLALLFIFKKNNNYHIILSGFCVGLGIVTRQSFVLQGLLLFSWLVFLSKDESFKKIIYIIVSFVLAVFAPIVIEILYSVYIHKFDSYSNMILRTVFYGSQAKNISFDLYLSRLMNLLNAQVYFLVPLVVFAGVGIFFLWRRNNYFGIFAIIWIIISIIVISTTAKFFLHYSQIPLVPLVIFAALGVSYLLDLCGLFSRFLCNSITIFCFLIYLVYFGHPQLTDFLSYINGDSTIREYWHKNNFADWSDNRKAAYFLKEKIKDGDTYFALTSHPLYFDVLGPGVIPRAILDISFLPPTASYLNWQGLTHLFTNYKESQKELIGIINSEKPPKWIAVSLNPYTQLSYKYFPKFFKELSAKYDFVMATKKEVLFKFNIKKKQDFVAPIPPALLVRIFQLRSIVINKDKIIIKGLSFFSDKDNYYKFQFFGDFETISAEYNGSNIFINDIQSNIKKYKKLIKLLHEIGIEIKTVKAYIRPLNKNSFFSACLNDFTHKKPFIINTSINDPVYRIMLNSPAGIYEGIGIYGRYLPLWSNNNWNKGKFLFFSNSENFSPMIFYAVDQKSAAVLYLNNFSSIQNVGNIIEKYRPVYIVKDDKYIFKIVWSSFNGDEIKITTINNIDDKKLNSINIGDKVKFDTLELYTQQNILEIYGAEIILQKINFYKGNIVFNKHYIEDVLYCAILIDGNLDYVGPNPDGIHRQLLYSYNKKRFYFLPSQQMNKVPGKTYKLIVVFSDNKMVYEII